MLIFFEVKGAGWLSRPPIARDRPPAATIETSTSRGIRSREFRPPADVPGPTWAAHPAPRPLGLSRMNAGGMICDVAQTPVLEVTNHGEA